MSSETRGGRLQAVLGRLKPAPTFAALGRLKPAPTCLAVLACVALTLTTRSATPAFFPDDPLQVDNDRALDAGKAKPIDGSNGYDFTEHTFIKPGDHRPIRAANVNTLDEVPDSTWFTNRIGAPGDDDRRDRARPQRRGHAQHRGLAGRRRQEQRDHPRLSHRRARRTSVSGEVRSAEQPGDGQQRRSDWRRLLSCRRLQRRPGVRRGRGPGEDRHRAHGHHGGHARTQEAHDARATSTNCSRAARSCPTANTARRSAGSPMADRSATSSTTARAPTTRTTFTRTSIAANCAPIASLAPG